jgi:hypothetical protein
LWGHYAGEAETKAAADARAAETGDVDQLVANVKAQAKRTESVIPLEDDWTENVVRDGGMALAVLIHLNRVSGRSFPEGKLISANAQSIEVHHIFPASPSAGA